MYIYKYKNTYIYIDRNIYIYIYIEGRGIIHTLVHIQV
jgi:hypothetical protein